MRYRIWANDLPEKEIKHIEFNEMSPSEREQKYNNCGVFKITTVDEHVTEILCRPFVTSEDLKVEK